MELGLESLAVEPLSTVRETDANASSDPYAALFDSPALDLVYLVELEFRPPQAS